MAKGKYTSKRKQKRNRWEMISLHDPRNQVKCVSNSKMLGRQVSMNTNVTIATNEGLKKSKQACTQLRQSFITKRELPRNRRLAALHSLIGSALLYSLHTFNHTYTAISKLQSSYSSCIIEAIEGIRNPETTRH